LGEQQGLRIAHFGFRIDVETTEEQKLADTPLHLRANLPPWSRDRSYLACHTNQNAA